MTSIHIMATTYEIGEEGVRKAIRILKKLGFSVTYENDFRKPWDIIAKRNDKIYYINVKYSSSSYRGTYAISTRSVQKIKNTENFLFMFIKQDDYCFFKPTQLVI